MVAIAHMPTPLGDVALAAEDGALICCGIAGQAIYQHIIEAGQENPNVFPLPLALEWLERYFAGNQPNPRDLPLSPHGTEFQRLVWGLLLDIPYGGLSTYGELAHLAALARGGGRMAAQAVGGAVGKNPLSIIIPCHRVLAAGGGLGGYGGGLDKKIWLLEHEGIDTSGRALWKTGRFSRLDAV